MPGQMPGQMQIASGTRVNAQWYGDGQFHPATVRGFDNGMYQVDWQEQRLGGNSYVYPHQIQVLTGAPGAMHGGMPGAMQGGMPGPHGAPPGKDMHGKGGMQPDPYGKGGMQPDPYGKGGVQPDPYGKGGMQPDPYGKGGSHDMHGKGMPGGGVAMGARVVAQHPNGTWYPGRVVGMQNGMVGVDWDDAKLGQSSWVQPQLVRPA
jgi:hypothetical protein